MRLLVVVTLLLTSFAGISNHYPTSSTQQTSAVANQKVKGLKAQLTIRRDDRGIPYVEANNDQDLYFGQGFVTASDRLWQMDLLRRTARGELAEILGSSALDQDKLHRTLGFAQVADAEANAASAKARLMLDSYSRGVNAYIDSLDPKSLPPEFQILQFKPRPWTPADSLIIVKIFAEGLSNTWRLDVMRAALSTIPEAKRALLLPETSPLDVLIVGKDKGPARSTASRSGSPFSASDLQAFDRLQEVQDKALARAGLYAEGLAASNNWVVSGRRTISGKPLLANDPHLQPTAPSIWYMVHLSAPGVRVAGVTGPGLPGIVIGHNENIAWGFTNVGPDVQDLYIERFDPTNPSRYATPGGWQNADIRHEQIKVRKAFADSSTDIVNYDVTVTRHGPVILEREGKRYALRWTALDPRLNNSDVNFDLNRARNWKDFSQALESFSAPTQNIVYADTEGHIGYHAAGVVPVRRSGDGSVPYDGATDDGEWTSFIPVAKLPQSFDPPSGIIVTANQRIVGSDYPFFLTHSWAQPYRARRIYELLNAKPKLDVDDFRRIQGDVYSIGGVLFTQQVSKSLRPKLTPDDEKLRATLDSFDSWDGQVNVDSRAALLASQMRIAFRSRILTAALGPDLVKGYQWSNFDTTLDWIIKEQPADWLPKEFPGYADLFRVSYNDAITAIGKAVGTDESKWKWGEMVKARFPHPLAQAPLIGVQFTIAPFPQNGTGGLLGATVNVGASVSMRFIADPSDWDKSQQGIALGESGLPKNVHWKDQLANWQSVTPQVFPFSVDSVKRAANETLTLEPEI